MLIESDSINDDEYTVGPYDEEYDEISTVNR